LKILIIGGLGYIGSMLTEHLKTFTKHEVVVVDKNLFPDGIAQPYSYLEQNYNSLPKDFIQGFDVVVHLAGHSSVPSCELNPDLSFKNNCLDFFHLVSKLLPSQKFIYASSGSVYTSTGVEPATEESEIAEPVMRYDAQKRLIDAYMKDTDINYFGLRFGTVCGYSYKPRNELMVNSMVRSAKTRGIVEVTNADSYRAILDINDLVRGIRKIIEGNGERGYYNLVSYNAKIHNIGKFVADHYGCNFTSLKAGNSAYSFSLSGKKMFDNFGFLSTHKLPDTILSAEHNDFKVERNWKIEL
jgi:UDP-glucose 4-epimerase